MSLNLPLSERWKKLVHPEHFSWTWNIFSTLYSERHRYYHTSLHIDKCLRILDDMPNIPGIHRDVVELALFWHDAIYIPGCKDNEKLSANLFDGISGTLIGVDDKKIQHIKGCILETAKHEIQDDITAQTVVDIDMAILGSNQHEYSIYTKWVRHEYINISDDAWRAGRGAFLEKTLSMPKIFGLDYMRERFETQARANLSHELKTLV